MIKRLRKLRDLKTKYKRWAYKRRLMCNSELTKETCSLAMFALSMEYNRQRYWWMKPLGFESN